MNNTNPAQDIVVFDGTREHAWKLGFYRMINEDGSFHGFIHGRADLADIRPVKGTRLIVDDTGKACGVAPFTDNVDPS